MTGTHRAGKRRRLLAAVCLGVLALCAAAFYNGLTVTRYTVKTDKLHRPVRAVLLSDLHSCVYGREQERLIARIDAAAPDLILMSGDIADDVAPHTGTFALLAGLANRYDCYYVTGNHEIWSGEAAALKDTFGRYGVRVLQGERETVTVAGQRVNICGADDPAVGEAAFEAQLDAAFRDIDAGLYTILLSHRPERLEQEARLGCDLILSGHAHGGQWRIPWLLDGVFAPDQGFFPKYTGGIYELGGTKLLVSRGLARETTRLPRIFNPPEVVVIDLVPA